MQISKYVIASAAVMLLVGGGVRGAGLQHSLKNTQSGVEITDPAKSGSPGVVAVTMSPAPQSAGRQTGLARLTPVAATQALVVPRPQGTGVQTDRPEDPRSQADYQRGLDAYQLGNYSTAVRRWEAAAERGHLVAQWNLVRLYTNGDLVATNPKRALYYLRSIAVKLDPNQPPSARSALKVAAYVELGRRYLDGVPEANLAPSPERAFRLFELAATLYGHPNAQHYLGLMYLGGQGVKRDLGRAIRWLVLAARKRYGPSQATLGDIFWKDKNSGNNRARSLMWFSLAKDNLRKNAYRDVVLDRYNTANSEANDDERKQALAMANNWRQETGRSAR